MIFPFESLSTEYREFGLLLAVVIGFLFGFILERAGFGRSTKLAAQFYLHDMTVFKVMFGAIVTASLGLVVFSGFGLVDIRALGEAAASPTFLVPMLVAGFLLGAGFIISGYCPGTSIVSTASGNIDGMFALGGVLTGTLIYGEIQPAVAKFHNMTDMGSLFIYDWLGIAPAWVGLGLFLMIFGSIAGVTLIERVVTRKRMGIVLDPPPMATRAFVMTTFGTLTVIGLATLIIPRAVADTPTKAIEAVDSNNLARRLVDEPWLVRVIDVRALDACSQKRVPGSECVPADKLGDLGLQYASGHSDLVLVDSDGSGPLPDVARKYPGKVLRLAGGFAAWQAFALDEPRPPAPDAEPQEHERYRFRAALHQVMTGARAAPPPPVPTQKIVPRKRKKGGGCS